MITTFEFIAEIVVNAFEMISKINSKNNALLFMPVNCQC